MILTTGPKTTRKKIVTITKMIGEGTCIRGG